MTTTQALDESKVEAFAGRMIQMLNDGMLALMTSVGHQTGLFDKLSTLPPSTSEQIASAAGLNERYVREWLGAMVTGGIVQYDPAARAYRLPPEHAMFVSRSGGPSNMATFTQFVALMGNVEGKLIDAFRNGGGVPYSEFGRFQELMAEESAQVVDASLVDATLPMIPGIVERLQQGIDVLDVGCGQGHAINVMAKAFANSRFTGYDFSEEGVAAGQVEAKRMGLSNSTFVAQDAAKMEDVEAFDFITAFDAIHDQAHPTEVLKRIARALRPGGVFLMVDIQASSNLEENLEHPIAPMLYSVSTAHCMTVSLALGGEGLGTVWGEQLARQKLAEAGFTNVDIKTVEGDIFNFYYIARKD
jgi:2-polyprenyl-3-methyl-5-hydroxy-6-metoxy-1,4-benzoquinol methylase